VSDFGRLWSYAHFLISVNALVWTEVYGTSWRVTYSTWWLIVCAATIQALFWPVGSPTQLPTVQCPYLDTWKEFKECGEGVVGWYSPGQCILYDSATNTCSKTCITLQWLCQHLMRKVRRQFRKGMHSRSGSVECVLLPYVFSSQCVCYIHNAFYIFSCRVCRYDLCVRFLW
jgi:hypothetical protein